MSTIAEFKIPYSQFLDHKGEVVQPLPEFAQDSKILIPLYRAMVEKRTFDSKAIALQRTGRMGTYASSLGQEAVGVGIGAAMKADDVLVPSYREYGAQFWRGVKMREVLLYWSGDERSNNYECQKTDLPICVTIGAHAGHAVGVAYALKLRNKNQAAVCTIGDGATSKGDFYEAINAAGVWKLPLVYVVSNNKFAISIRYEQQTAAQTIAQKAIAAGFSGEQIDGNDVIAVRQAVDQALQKARRGDGPTLIEAMTYRLSDHTTADDASRYRTQEELSQHWVFEPISRLRKYLTELKVWGKNEEDALIKECAAKVQREVDEYLNTPPQDPSGMFDHLYETLPSAFEDQREELRKKGRVHA